MKSDNKAILRRFILIPTALAFALRISAFCCLAINLAFVFDEMMGVTFSGILVYAVVMSTMGWICLQVEQPAYFAMKNSRIHKWAMIKFDNWKDYDKFISETSPKDLDYLASMTDEQWAAFDLNSFRRSDS